MNAPFDPPSAMARHAFTLDDVLELQAQGLVDQRSQLLDGDIYDMPSDGRAHRIYAMGIARFLMRELDDTYFVGVQTTLPLAKHNAPSPDIYVLAAKAPLSNADTPADEILLVIEIADTTLRDNLTSSAARYAAYGVREYWVVDVNTPCIYVHRDPVNGAYPQPVNVEAGEALAARLVPQVCIRLADFG